MKYKTIITNPEIIETSDGSQTIHVPALNEHYHSVFGARTESEFVYLEKGYNFSKTSKPNVLEIGFGTGLNALLTALSAENQQRKTFFVTLEKYPLPLQIVQQLKYGSLISEEATQIFRKIQAAPWNSKSTVSPYFELLKIEADLTNFEFHSETAFDVIYFDAFGPDKQPEMWTPEIFGNIFKNTSVGGVFVTYSAKGEVRRNLAAAGFTMERLPGPPGKKQMLRGIKQGCDS